VEELQPVSERNASTPPVEHALGRDTERTRRRGDAVAGRVDQKLNKLVVGHAPHHRETECDWPKNN
jgi:hypothetical protein